MAILHTPFTDNKNALLRSERIAGGILPRILGSFDLIAIVVAVILWIPNAALITRAGAAAYVYWLLGFFTFLIPGAIVTGQLGLMFPGEGSIYVWTTKAFGSFMGFLAGFCAWWPGVLVIVAASDTVVSLIQSLGQLFGAALLIEPGQQGLVIILIITFSFLLSVLRFRVTQNLVNMIFLTYGGAILLVGLAGVFWLLTKYHAGIVPSSYSGSWLPNGGNITFYGNVILALLGIEVPLNMGVEIRDTRSITRYLLWGSVVVVVAYLLCTFGVMTAVPIKDQGYISSIVEAVQIGFGPFGTVFAALVNLIFIGFFLFVTAVYNYSFGRLIFVSGLDRRLPPLMSKINANKVSWIAVLVQSVIAALLTAVIFVFAPYVIPIFSPADMTNIIYDILQAATTVIWCVSMVLLFVDVLIIHNKYQGVFARIRLAPDWMFYLCAVVGIFASIFGIGVVFTKSWTPLVATPVWNACIIGITAISLIVAIGVFYVGQRTIESNISDEEIIKEVTS